MNDWIGEVARAARRLRRTPSFSLTVVTVVTVSVAILVAVSVLADGVLRMSNERTSTGFPIDEGLQFARFDFQFRTADAFEIEVSYSVDGGKVWQNYNRLYFKRVVE